MSETENYSPQRTPPATSGYKNYASPAITDDAIIPVYLDKLQRELENLEKNIEILSEKLGFISHPLDNDQSGVVGYNNSDASECLQNITRKLHFVEELSQKIVKITLKLDL